MLKNDMRKYLIEGKSFEQFYEEKGDEYTEFSDDTLARCWENTKELIPRDEWLKYLKVKSGNYAKYLETTADALLEEGIPLNSIKAGGIIAGIYAKQRDYWKDKAGVLDQGA